MEITKSTTIRIVGVNTNLSYRIVYLFSIAYIIIFVLFYIDDRHYTYISLITFTYLINKFYCNLIFLILDYRQQQLLKNECYKSTIPKDYFFGKLY